MASVAEHYDRLLGEHYTRMFGDFDVKVAEQRKLFERLEIAGPGVAVDLGCGSGFQSVALARLGFQVRALDLCERLLRELDRRRGMLPIETVRADILTVTNVVAPGAQVAVCMGDTLSHLSAKADVELLFGNVRRVLVPRGRLVLTFRDLTVERLGLERVVPVLTSDDTLITCFLEFEPEAVVVHDLVHTRHHGTWTLDTSAYRKLRLGEAGVVQTLQQLGWELELSETVAGLVTICARAC